MKVVVTGASGLIGSALVPALGEDGHQVVTLVRREPRSASEIRWDPSAGQLDPAALAGVLAAVHLAGAGVGDHRWTKAYKQTILDSRVQGTTLLAKTLARLDPLPRVLLSASGMGFYGSCGDTLLAESAPGGQGFLPTVAHRWEAATGAAEQAGIRVCHLRSSLVLSARGGVMRRLMPLFKAGLGGKLGSGRQWWSWITLDDEVGAIRLLLDADGVRGPVNLATPNPVRNAEFAAALASALHRPALLPAPAFGLKVVLGEFSSEVLSSTRLDPAVLRRVGYTFAQPDLGSALAAVVAGRT